MDLENQELLDILKKLDKKYTDTGQDLTSYLEGLYHAKYLNYWDYIAQETLLSLQRPRTNFPDEKVFIMYHQITELYFKLTLHELKQLRSKEDIDGKYFLSKVGRVNRYFEALTSSFGVMVDGMEREQFLTFRLTLQPASGFQSSQYRLIEIMSTNFLNLVSKDHRANFKTDSSIKDMFEYIYWKEGANHTLTGKKAFTMVQFEEKYNSDFLKMAKESRGNNIWDIYKSLPEEDQQNQEIIEEMKWYDVHVNVNWPLAHYRSAVKYLIAEPHAIAATGGTNWRKYLPPRFQKRIFYPELWSDQEKEDWGKGWVDSVVNEHTAKND